MSARRFLRLTHGWIGAVLALFLLLVAGSGASLAFMSEMFLAQYGEVLEAEAPAPGAEQIDVDAIFASAQAARGDGWTPVGLFMPHTRVPKVSTAMAFGMEEGGDPLYPMMVSVDTWTGETKGAFSLADAFGHDMIDFHFELTMGEAGATFVSVLGVLLVLFAGTGIWLWWPRKGYVWRKARAPHLKGNASTKLYHLHGWLGVWTALLVVVFSLSGTALVKPQWFGPALTDVHEQEPHGGAWARQCEGTVTPGEAAALAQARFPDRSLSTIYLVPGEPIHVFMRGEGDLNRMEGDALFWQHPTCAGLSKAVDISAASAPEQAKNLLLSLHGGYIFGPVLGPLLVLITGLSLVFFTISGMWVFFTRTLRPRRRKARKWAEDVVPAE